jgi:hypothetical protein
VKQETHEFRGKQVTFRGLFDQHAIVKIPIIQRDYAQGRMSATEVRTEFLTVLCRTLEKNGEDATLPLDLDFVYGSVESSAQQAFLLLDGQQRLTTLFLLHWYLAWKDGKWDEFKAFIKDGDKSRFSYSVRPSSEEFFDFLVNYVPTDNPGGSIKLSDFIADQSRFYRSWTLDPTIQSALEMLDAIDGTFARKAEFYERLVRIDRPYITFQLLDLKNFGLSDELYIKMNARGKALTAFEAFKAKLEQKLDTLFPVKKMTLRGMQVSVKSYFSDRIDSNWADLFWGYKDEDFLYDEKIMNLLRALVIVTREPGLERTMITLKELIVEKLPFSFFKYDERGCIDEPLVETLISVLDKWFERGASGIKIHLCDATYYDERGAFAKVINDATKLTYVELVQFHAYCAYIRENQDDLQTDCFWDWMRVIRNLSENTSYDGPDDFVRSIRSVNDLLDASQRIVAEIANPKVDVRGFNQQQVREEQLKAQLIRRNDEWRLYLLEAEKHVYFQGQIEFLLAFTGVLDRWLETRTCTWNESENAEYLKRFRDYFAKASAIFSANGLIDFGESRWERALLSIGDYLLPHGNSGNRSFLLNKDRDVSWKRLLQGAIDPNDFVEKRRRYVKALFDQIDLNIGIIESLESVIGHANPSDEWRRVIVRKHELMEFCEKRMIRFVSENRVYLLRKVRMSAEHVELFSYNLHTGLLAAKNRQKELIPFGNVGYQNVKTDLKEPYAFMEYIRTDGTIALHIFNKDGGYALKLLKVDGVLPQKLKESYEGKSFFESEDVGSISWTVDRKEIGAVIDGVVDNVREFGKALP